MKVHEERRMIGMMHGCRMGKKIENGLEARMDAVMRLEHSLQAKGVTLVPEQQTFPAQA